MKLKITDEKLDELAVNSERSHDLQMMCDDGVNMDSLMQVTHDSFFNGYRAAEQVHQVTVDKLNDDITKLKADLALAVEALTFISKQSTTAEYLESENEDLDGETCLDAWDFLISDARKALLKLKNEGV